MKRLSKILVPTDLSETSRRAVIYGCWLAEQESASLLILHVADEMDAWQFHSEDFGFGYPADWAWPADRVVSEAALDLNRFLEPQLGLIKALPLLVERVVLGPVAQTIARIAEDEEIDLLILSPRRRSSLKHWFTGGITDRVTRFSPCPVLSVTPPFPSPSWRGRLAAGFFGWSRPTATNAR